MTGFVIDASLAASWFLPDEASPATDELLDRLVDEEAAAPSLFRHEMRNLMLVAHRRGRLSREKLDDVLTGLALLPIHDYGSGDDARVVALATKHGLTAYDAAYLALALERQMPLATLDRALATAARSQGVPLLGPRA